MFLRMRSGTSSGRWAADLAPTRSSRDATISARPVLTGCAVISARPVRADHAPSVRAVTAAREIACSPALGATTSRSKVGFKFKSPSKTKSESKSKLRRCSLYRPRRDPSPENPRRRLFRAARDPSCSGRCSRRLESPVGGPRSCVELRRAAQSRAASSCVELRRAASSCVELRRALELRRAARR